MAVLGNICVVQVWVYMPHYTKSKFERGGKAGSGVQVELLCSMYNIDDE